MQTAFTVQLSEADRKALETRAERKGITPEQEAVYLIHEAVKTEPTAASGQGIGLGTALAEIWGGLDLPDHFEFEELQFSGFDEDPFDLNQK
jgi:hypothetical protein